MKLFQVLVLLSLFSCGHDKKPQDGVNGKDGVNGSSCKAETVPNGAKISCTDGSFAYIYNGQNGLNCSVTSIPRGVRITCGTQPSVDVLSGIDGSNGADGVSGQNCIVDSLTNGLKVTCGSSAAYVYDGKDAPITPYSLVKEIQPCGPGSSPWKEVILCMAGGDLLASFSDNASGTNTRLSNIPQGNYIDTDASSCNFSVSIDANNNSTVTWNAGSNQYGSWSANSIVCLAQ